MNFKDSCPQGMLAGEALLNMTHLGKNNTKMSFLSNIFYFGGLFVGFTVYLHLITVEGTGANKIGMNFIYVIPSY